LSPFKPIWHTDYEPGEKTLREDKNGSIHCFVEKTTGDIFKPAGWKAPYTKGKNCVRGNIYDSSSFEKTDMHGGWLYANSVIDLMDWIPELITLVLFGVGIMVLIGFVIYAVYMAYWGVWND